MGEIFDMFFIEKLIGALVARLLENENHIFFVRCIAAVAFLVLRDRLAGETLIRETYKCGLPPAPRKASNLERKSTTFKSNKVYENSLLLLFSLLF